LNPAVALPAQALDFIPVMDPDAPFSAQHDGLQLLRSHYGAQTGSCRDPAVVVADSRYQGQPFTRRTDASHPRPTAGRPDQDVLRLHGVPPPEVSRVAEFRAVVPDVEIHGTGADAGQEDAVVAAAFDGWREIAAAVGFAPAPRQR